LLILLLLEKTFEGRHQHGGFGASLLSVFHDAEIHYVLANTICLSGALLGFNALSIVKRRLGPGGLSHLFLSPLPAEAGDNSAPRSGGRRRPTGA